MIIKILECPIVGCDSKEVEQITETTLVGYPRGLIDKNHLSVYCHCKKCNTYFTFRGSFLPVDENNEKITELGENL